RGARARDPRALGPPRLCRHAGLPATRTLPVSVLGARRGRAVRRPPHPRSRRAQAARDLRAALVPARRVAADIRAGAAHTTTLVARAAPLSIRLTISQLIVSATRACS